LVLKEEGWCGPNLNYSYELIKKCAIAQNWNLNQLKKSIKVDKLSYLSRSAMKKVITGRQFVEAAAKVGEV